MLHSWVQQLHRWILWCMRREEMTTLPQTEWKEAPREFRTHLSHINRPQCQRIKFMNYLQMIQQK